MIRPIIILILSILILTSCTTENYELIEGDNVSSAFILNSSPTFKGYFYKGSDEDFHYFVCKWKYFVDKNFKMYKDDLMLYCSFSVLEDSEMKIDVFKTDEGIEIGGNEFYTLFTVNDVCCPKEHVMKLKENRKLKQDKLFDFYCTQDCEKDVPDDDRYYKMYRNHDHKIIRKTINDKIISIEFLIVASCCQEFIGDYKIVNDTLNIDYENIGGYCSCLCTTIIKLILKTAVKHLK